jgi:2-polyprenyl-6-methoxyphenol hydroxylase-like FAD-dependent oxidoreductase
MAMNTILLPIAATMTVLGHWPEFGCELVGLDQDGDGVMARLTGKAEQIIRVRYLIGADGGRSFVRRALDIGSHGKTLEVRAVVADVLLTGLGRDAWHRFNEGSMGRQMSLCPLAGTELFQLQAPVPLEGDVDLSVQGLTAMVAERTDRDDVRRRTENPNQEAVGAWSGLKLSDEYRDAHTNDCHMESK